MSYLSRAEAQTIISFRYRATTSLRAAWDAATDAERDAAIEQASDDIDAVRWVYRVAVLSQVRMWPRVVVDGAAEMLEAYDGAYSSIAAGSWTVAGLPREVRLATAIQAAHRLARSSGLDPAAHVEHAAALGITSQSASGMTETYDLQRAASPFARLHPDAQGLLERFRARGGDM